MAKLDIVVGTTSKRLSIFIQDSSKGDGSGLTGLVYNSAGLSWYYWREDAGNGGGTSVTLATATRGTFTSGGFIEKDATNLPGWYEIGIPNAALASGASWVVMELKGAANMAPVLIELSLISGTVALADGAITAAKIASAAITEAKFGDDAFSARVVADDATDPDALVDAFLAAMSSDTGTAAAGASGTITLASSAVASNDYYNDQIVWIRSGTGAGQARHISDYNSSRVASVTPNWVTNPSTDSVYYVFPEGRVDVAALADTLQTARDIGASVLLSPGTGTGQVNLSSGAVPVTGDLTSTMKASVNTEVDTALSDYDAPTRAEATSDVNSVLSRLGTPAGASVSADIAAVKSDSAAILVDTGTTLDGKIDTIDANVDSILVDTGTTLDAKLDTIQAVTDKVDTALESDGASGYQFTDVALENAPSGSGLDAAGVRAAVGLASANLDTQLGDIPTNSELATALAGADDATLAAIAALNDISPAEVNAEVDTALADYDAPTRAEATSDVNSVLSRLGTPAGASVSADVAAVKSDTAAILTDTGTTLDGKIDAIQTVTDKLDTALEDDGASGYQFTEVALENAPSGTGASAATIADAVWEEILADHSGTTGSTAEALNAAGDAGDPWMTALPGAYGAGSAGKIIGDNLNATISSRASQTSVDDIPTNSELATALAGADDATLAAIAALNDLSAAEVNAEVDTALADYDAPTNAEMVARTLPAASYATASALDAVDNYVDTEVAAIKVVTDKLDTALEQDGTEYRFTTNALEQAPTDSGGGGLDAAGVRAALGMASANLDTQLSGIAGYVDTEVASILAIVQKLDTAMEADGLVYRFTVNALEQAPAGGGAGGNQWLNDILQGVTDGDYTSGMAGWLLAQIYAKALLITSGSITVASPLNLITGDLTIVKGDDYTVASGRALPEWSSDDWTPLDLTSATQILLKLKGRFDGNTFSFSATAVTDTQVQATITSAQSSQLKVGNKAYRYEVEATLAGGSIVTLARGDLNVASDVR